MTAEWPLFIECDAWTGIEDDRGGDEKDISTRMILAEVLCEAMSDFSVEGNHTNQINFLIYKLSMIYLFFFNYSNQRDYNAINQNENVDIE